MNGNTFVKGNCKLDSGVSMIGLGRGTKDGGHVENVLVVSLQFRSPSGG